MANRLEHETSPYLLQHKDNPVDWWPWGPEALAAARSAGKPILLSVGYAACHWCHVMAHESFEDPATAAVMNDLFVNIKVDREERPDIDAIYMKALHSLGEHGGWPLTMFLTPDARPFWGGTYFPPTERYGKPSFQRVLREIARLHREEPERIEGNAVAILERLREPPAGGGGQVREDGIRDLAVRLAAAVDPINGGLRGAPKFPQFSIFWLLWRAGLRFGLAECLEATHTTLTRICQGGIYDHIGGGFARYSVDERWLVPHFEKMLYDNALLIRLMTEVWQERRDPLLAQRVEETVAWLAREMRTPEGGFAASYDADSEGEEGKFYLWTPAEIEAVLEPGEADLFCRLYDITEPGNFEGRNIPNRLGKMALEDLATEQRLIGLHARLHAARSARVPPGWDDKVLADWNGLAIEALALASRAFGRPDWLALARAGFELVRTAMTVDGRLVHARRLGRARGPATAADYANMIAAALALHQVESRPDDLAAARDWAEVLHRHYWNVATGGYCFTADDTPDVIVRSPGGSDDATPNANGVMITCLVHLHLLTGEAVYRERAEATLAAFMGEVASAPAGHTGLLAGALDLLSPQHVVLLGPGADPLAEVIGALSLPGAVVQILPVGAPPAPAGTPLHGKGPIGGRATAYVCAGMACSAPLVEPEDLREALIAARTRRSG